MEYVYLIVNTNSHYKIGRTKNPIDKRMKAFKTANSEHINLVREYRTEYSRQLEKMLHNLFKLKRIEGEWFVLDKDDVSNFTNICKKLEDDIIFLKLNNPFFK